MVRRDVDENALVKPRRPSSDGLWTTLGRRTFHVPTGTERYRGSVHANRGRSPGKVFYSTLGGARNSGLILAATGGVPGSVTSAGTSRGLKEVSTTAKVHRRPTGEHASSADRSALYRSAPRGDFHGSPVVAAVEGRGFAFVIA